MKNTKTAGSKWKTVRRCLIILRQLQRAPANRPTLMRYVREALPEAYGPASDDARQKAFERDLENLRHWLYVAIDWDRQNGVYRLVDIGPYAGIDLSDEALQGLSTLMATFDPDSGGYEIVRPLLDELFHKLPDDRRRQLNRNRAALYLELTRLDEGKIDPLVWRKVKKAVNRRVLHFRYVSRRNEPDDYRSHTVEPYTLQFSKGHYELKAYCRRWRNLRGESRSDAGWFRYRLDRILPEEMEILPQVIRAGQRQKRLAEVRYLVSPDLAKGGISRRFEALEVVGVDKDGWVEMKGKTDDLFEARRIFLAYGQNCKVLAPSSLVYEMKQAAQKMAEFYGDG